MELQISVLYAPTARTIYHLRTLLSICDVRNEGFGDVETVSCPNLNATSLASARALRDRTKYNFETVLFLLTCEWD